MTCEPLYLKPNVVLEPLVDQWYAWPHLIPPATAARNITERHLRIMDSYIAAPHTHAAAVRNPKLLGGPFMDFEGGRVREVEALREKTKSARADLIELSQAIVDLDRMLREHAAGYSLEPLYEKVPEPLQGFVELVYDLNNQASFRLIEPLLYRSKYYDRGLQTLMLSTISRDERPFVLSTPRLESEGHLHLEIPFDHEGVDALCRMKSEPATFCSIKSILNVPDSGDELLASFLTSEKPRPYSRYEGEGARWRYFGHACVLLETRDVSILVDPVLSYTYEGGMHRYTYEDLPERIDYVLISHNHQDHLLFETLLQLRHRIGTVIVPRNGGAGLQDPSLKLTLQNCGFRNVVEAAEMDEIEIDSGTITAIPFLGEHSDLDVRTKLAYAISLRGHSILFAADSCNISPRMYRHVHAAIGDVDVMFLGMECDGAPLSWMYGPLLTQKLDRAMDHSRRLAGSNFAKGMAMVDQFRCRELYVYAMGQEPWLNYVMSLKYTDDSNPIVQSNKLIETCRQRGIVAERLFGEKEICLSGPMPCA